MTAARSRLERVRASAGIAQLALRQIEDELADLADAELVAGVLRELFDESDPQGGLLGSLQNAEIQDLRHQITRLTLAAAVLTHDQDQRGPALEDTGNVVNLRPPT
ncbi:hypothetical protein AB0M38_33620 [Streptomyces sp. NPDC051742]|uniref:hypothetical protein n=1 Tax=unclassified Streptomyces TaxID=2593676 RepID=UPI00342F1DF4